MFHVERALALAAALVVGPAWAAGATVGPNPEARAKAIVRATAYIESQ